MFDEQKPAIGIKQLIENNPMIGPQKTGEKRFWTTREQKVVRELYQSGGVLACVDQLPGRSAHSIYSMAAKLGIKYPVYKRGFRPAFPTNEYFDAAIKRVYQGTPKKGEVNELCRTLQRPRGWVARRARALGCMVPRFGQLPWSDAEIAIISNEPHLGLSSQYKKLRQAGFHRSETAIAVKLQRLSLDRTDPDHGTANSVAVLMGVNQATVVRWIEKEWLKAKKRGWLRSEGQNGDHWWISRKDLREFIIGNASAVDLRKVDKDWFIDLLGNG